MRACQPSSPQPPSARAASPPTTRPLPDPPSRRPAIEAFVRRSEGATDVDSIAGHHTDEDVAMGFWLSRYHLSGELPIHYVRHAPSDLIA